MKSKWPKKPALLISRINFLCVYLHGMCRIMTVVAPLSPSSVSVAAASAVEAAAADVVAAPASKSLWLLRELVEPSLAEPFTGGDGSGSSSGVFCLAPGPQAELDEDALPPSNGEPAARGGGEFFSNGTGNAPRSTVLGI